MVYTFKLSDILSLGQRSVRAHRFCSAAGLINMILKFRILAEGFAQNFKKLNCKMDFSRNSNFRRYCLKFYGICAVSK